jgi:hypothetical protein
LRIWVRDSFRFAVGAFVVYACAGKSISRSDGDDVLPMGDEGTAGTGPTIAVGGGIGKGGSVGKGGTAGNTIGKGGSVGKGGTAGTSTTGGRGGGGGTGNVAGDDRGGAGAGGDECGPRRAGGVDGNCTAPPGCISIVKPRLDQVARNETAQGGTGGGGGESGAAGDSGDDGADLTTAVLCSVPDGSVGFLAVDYFMPANGVGTPGFSLIGGTRACDGYTIGNVTFGDFAMPPRGTWTTQCVAVTATDLERTVTVGVPYVTPPYARVRNLRFVSSCACPRQITRYTTCGDITSPRICQ